MNTQKINQAIYAITLDYIAKHEDGNPFAHHTQHDYYMEELGMDSDSAWEKWEQDQETPPEGEELNKFLYWLFFNKILTNALSDAHEAVMHLVANGAGLELEEITKANVDEAIHRIDIFCPEVRELIKHHNLEPVNVRFYMEGTNEPMAVFPESRYAFQYDCYSHNGQHSKCSIDYAEGLPLAAPDQYKDLLAELQQIYPNLNVLNEKAKNL